MDPRIEVGLLPSQGYIYTVPSPEPTLLVSGSVISDLYALIHLILSATLCKRYCLSGSVLRRKLRHRCLNDLL